MLHMIVVEILTFCLSCFAFWQVPVTENLEAACTDNYKEDLASNYVLKLGSLTDVDVPLLIDKVEKVEKTMELDDVSTLAFHPVTFCE